MPFFSWESRDFHFVVITKISTLLKILEISWLYLSVFLRVILFFLITSINQGPRMPLIFPPRSQNEIINVIGHDIILANIVAEVKQSKFYSVLADEVSCHNVEQLPVCLRFVDSEGSIREEFIAFLKLNRVRAVDIADALVKCLENLGLSLSELGGQGYDGASTMSGHKSGVQARIQEKQPKAVYTHCAAHSLKGGGFTWNQRNCNTYL